MSETFEAILVQAPNVRAGMNACHIIAFVFAVYFAIKARRSLTCAFVIAVLGGLAAQVTFERWWGSLNAAIVNDEDFKWIANHDGGGLIIVFLGNAVKAFGVFLFSGAIGGSVKKHRQKSSSPNPENTSP